MTERKRRGLGRGLGALINSDGQEAEASSATAHAVSGPEVSRETAESSPDAATMAAVSEGENLKTPPKDSDGPMQEYQAVTWALADGDGGVPSAGVSESSEEEPAATDAAHRAQTAPTDAYEEYDASFVEDGLSEAPLANEAAPQETAPERPIDVFFSAKSHLDTQRVPRGTASATARSTSSRRSAGNGRVEMPDVLGDRARRSPTSATSMQSAPSAMSAEAPSPESGAADQQDRAAPSPAEDTIADTSERPTEVVDEQESPSVERPSRRQSTGSASLIPKKTPQTSSNGTSSGTRKKTATSSAPTTASTDSSSSVQEAASAVPATAAAPETEDVPRGTEDTVDGAQFRSIPVHSIEPNPRQPREEFDEDDMAELVHSVREIGVLQPIVVRRTGEEQYELVMGERRWRASKAAEKAEIPAIVRATEDIDLLRDALLENIHRSELNPLEEAAAYRQLLDDFQCTQDELATRIGRSRPQISNTLRLMKLPPGVQRRVAAGVLSSGHARALLGLSSQEQMEELAGRIVAEGLSVRATEEAVTMMQQPSQEDEVSREASDRLPSNTRYQQLDEYADALTDRLDTPVKITLGARKGRIAIDFGSIEDLHRLMEMIGQTQNS